MAKKEMSDFERVTALIYSLVKRVEMLKINVVNIPEATGFLLTLDEIGTKLNETYELTCKLRRSGLEAQEVASVYSYVEVEMQHLSIRLEQMTLAAMRNAKRAE